MSAQHNEHGLPIGAPLTTWTPPHRPSAQRLVGRWCHLRPLEPDLDAPALFQTLAHPAAAPWWTYLPDAPPATAAEFHAWAVRRTSEPSTQAYVIVEPNIDAVRGTLSYLRIDPPNGSIELGMILFAAGLQRTTAATESIYLLLRHAFELGYRRVEWKCDSLNAPSRRAAERFGFTFEGIFRQAVVTKGRNRDTAWYSMLDREWPTRRLAFESWLAPTNFDSTGRQRGRLSDLIAVARSERRPAVEKSLERSEEVGERKAESVA
ncbi:MAG TPA: GNAT family protein [Verrucomicrobiota bacterium]|nr:GNAT family N-acetyltransferase [Verrucomicrobiales bacterium]HRI11879.1 GNAT family protein [Verrucomicrobiota bacterium]